jgi:hypothetical protein
LRGDRNHETVDASAKQPVSGQDGGLGPVSAVAGGDTGLGISVDSDVTTEKPFSGTSSWRERGMMPFYSVRHLSGEFEELPCLLQLEDECAAMYFNIVHGVKLRRRFTTEQFGRPCEDYLLVARDVNAAGLTAVREIALFE